MIFCRKNGVEKQDRHSYDNSTQIDASRLKETRRLSTTGWHLPMIFMIKLSWNSGKRYRGIPLTVIIMRSIAQEPIIQDFSSGIMPCIWNLRSVSMITSLHGQASGVNMCRCLRNGSLCQGYPWRTIREIIRSFPWRMDCSVSDLRTSTWYLTVNFNRKKQRTWFWITSMKWTSAFSDWNFTGNGTTTW